MIYFHKHKVLYTQRSGSVWQADRLWLLAMDPSVGVCIYPRTPMNTSLGKEEIFFSFSLSLFFFLLIKAHLKLSLWGQNSDYIHLIWIHLITFILSELHSGVTLCNIYQSPRENWSDPLPICVMLLSGVSLIYLSESISVEPSCHPWPVFNKKPPSGFSGSQSLRTSPGLTKDKSVLVVQAGRESKWWLRRSFTNEVNK